MGTLFSALELGRAGMQVAQVQLDVAGHNVASVNKEGYSRQRVDLITRVPNIKIYGALGRGPAVAGVFRLRDQFLDTVFRQEVAGLGNAEVQASYFTRLEDGFQEPSENGFSHNINDFFDSVNDFANNVEDLSVRVGMLTEGESVARSLNDIASHLRSLRTNANEEVRNLVPEINSITERIAELNDVIHDAEVTGRPANDLRDDRDLLLDELAKLVKISYNERDNGIVDVLLGSDMLVTGDHARVLEAVADPSIDPDRPDFVTVQFADNGNAATILDGELAGTIHMRDVELLDMKGKMDDLARALIKGINDIHVNGNGLVNYSGTLTSSNPVTGQFDPFDSAGLELPVTDGSFDLEVYNASGVLVESVTIPVISNATSMFNLPFWINSLSNMSATFQGATNTLSMTATPGYTFNILNDTTGLPTALGLNTFFTGDSAETIGVQQDLINNPGLISSGYSADPLETGDNSAALDMLQIRDAALLSGDTQTINEFFESIIVEVGIDAKSNEDSLIIQEAFIQDFEARRQEVSGVNIDEEVTNLLQFQRAFEASARVISVTDRMLDALMAMAR